MELADLQARLLEILATDGVIEGEVAGWLGEVDPRMVRVAGEVVRKWRERRDPGRDLAWSGSTQSLAESVAEFRSEARVEKGSG